MAAPEAAAAAAAATVVDIQPLLPDEKATEQLWILYSTHPVLQSVLDLKVQYEGLVDRAKHNNPVISGKEFTRRRKRIAKHYPKFPPTLDARDWLSQALFIYHGRDVATASLMHTMREKHGQEALSFLGNYDRGSRGRCRSRPTVLPQRTTTTAAVHGAKVVSACGGNARHGGETSST